MMSTMRMCFFGRILFDATSPRGKVPKRIFLFWNLGTYQDTYFDILAYTIFFTYLANGWVIWFTYQQCSQNLSLKLVLVGEISTHAVVLLLRLLPCHAQQLLGRTLNCAVIQWLKLAIALCVRGVVFLASRCFYVNLFSTGCFVTIRSFW